MSEPTNATTPAAAPAAEPTAPAAAAPAAAATVDERFDAALSKVRGEEPAPPAEPAEEPAPPAEEPAPPAEPPAERPTLAEATRRLKAAKDSEAKLIEERKAFEAETARVRDIIEKSWPEFELGRDLVALKGQPAGKILARLRAAGLDIDASSLAAAVLEPSDDDRPMTVREWNELQRKADDDRRQAEEEAKAKAKGDEESKAKAARDASENAFVALASAERAPVSSKVLARFGAHGRALLLDRAWKAQATRTGAGQPLSLDLLLADVEASVAKEFPEFAPAPAPTATTPAAPTLSVVRPSAVSNSVASRTSGPRRLSEEERWAEFERKQQAKGARLNGSLSHQHHPRKRHRRGLPEGSHHRRAVHGAARGRDGDQEGLRWKASHRPRQDRWPARSVCRLREGHRQPEQLGLGGVPVHRLRQLRPRVRREQDDPDHRVEHERLPRRRQGGDELLQGLVYALHRERPVRRALGRHRSDQERPDHDHADALQPPAGQVLPDRANAGRQQRPRRRQPRPRRLGRRHQGRPDQGHYHPRCRRGGLAGRRLAVRRRRLPGEAPRFLPALPRDGQRLGLVLQRQPQQAPPAARGRLVRRGPGGRHRRGRVVGHRVRQRPGAGGRHDVHELDSLQRALRVAEGEVDAADRLGQEPRPPPHRHRVDHLRRQQGQADQYREVHLLPPGLLPAAEDQRPGAGLPGQGPRPHLPGLLRPRRVEGPPLAREGRRDRLAALRSLRLLHAPPQEPHDGEVQVMGAAAHHARTVRRGVIDVEVLLAGAGVGVVPTADSGNYVESIERTAPGRLVLTLKAGHTALLAYLGGVQKDDLDATPARKHLMAGETSIKSDRTIEILIGDGDQSRQIDEWTDPLAAAAAGIKAATPVVEDVVELTAADLLAGGKAELLARPRNITFTTSGGTPADAPATATIVGTDINGDVLTETVNLAQTATIASGLKAFRTIETITYPAGDGTDASVAIGFGNVFGFSKKIRTRAGALMYGKEISAGSVVTNGTLVSPTTSPPNGTYSPNSAPDGSKDYAIEYEPDGTGKDLAEGETVVLYLRLTQAVGLV